MPNQDKQKQILKKMKNIVSEIKELKQEGFEIRKEVKDKIDEAKAEALREEIQES